MSEELETKNNQPEETPVDQVQPVVEVQETPVVEAAPVEQVDEVKELNFRALRNAKRKAEEERDELYSRINESKKYKPVVNETELEKNRRDIRELKQSWQHQQDKVATENIERQLKETYPDLDNVINQDNIELLKARDANFSKMVNSSPTGPSDLYHRAIAAYSLIKKYGIHVDDKHVDARAKVAGNMAKPRPASAAATTSEGLADFSGFVNMNKSERRKAIFTMARNRANS